MYVLTCDDKTIYGPGSRELILSDVVLTMGLNKNGTLSFTVPPVNPEYNNITPMKSVIKVYNDHEEIWRGRVLDFKSDFNNSAPITCEGLLGYLNDSMVRPDDDYRLDGDEDIPAYLQILLDIHNEQVDDARKIYLGDVTVEFPAIADYDPMWSIADYQVTKTHISNVVNRFDGYLIVRSDEEDKLRLDYLKEFTHTAMQEIKFAQNLLDIEKKFQGDKFKTAIIPLGANGLTIEDVNDGKDYLVDEEAVKKYGLITGTAQYSEIDDDEELLQTALRELKTHTGVRTTIVATAIDLSAVDKTVESFKLGDKVHAVSPPHEIDETLQVSEIRLNISAPDKSEITMGDPLETFTGRST